MKEQCVTHHAVYLEPNNDRSSLFYVAVGYLQSRCDVFMRLTLDPRIGRKGLHVGWSGRIYSSMGDLSGLFLRYFSITGYVCQYEKSLSDSYLLEIPILIVVSSLLNSIPIGRFHIIVS